MPGVPREIRDSRIEEYLKELEGAAVAELLVRLLARASFDDVACLIIDAIIYLGQGDEVGASPTDISELLGLEIHGAQGNVIANKGLDSALQTLVAKLLVTEESAEMRAGASAPKGYLSKKKTYRIDYLWAFHMAEERYSAVMKEVEKIGDEPTRGYACTRCKTTFCGAFAVFNLKRETGTGQLYCSSCNGAVEELVLQANVDKVQLRNDCMATFSVVKAILNMKKDMYVPKDAVKVYSSGDVLSAREYRNFQEQTGLKQFQASVFQMEVGDAKAKDLASRGVKVQLSGESREQRARHDVEDKKRQREVSTNIPWLDDIAKRRKRGRGGESDGVGATVEAAPKARHAPKEIRRLGHTALSEEDARLRRFEADTYCYYLHEAGYDLPEATAGHEYVSISQYMAGQAWERLPRAGPAPQ